MSWWVWSISYLCLLLVSLMFNKRITSVEKYTHNALVYIPFALILMVYLSIGLFLYIIQLCLTSRFFYSPMKPEDCPVGEENRIPTILTPVDKLCQAKQRDCSCAVTGLIGLRGKFCYVQLKSAILNDFAYAKDKQGRLLYPKLTQVVKERFLFSTWEYFPHFNIDNHITEKCLDLSEGSRELDSFISTIHSSNLPSGIPGFQFYVIHDKNREEYTDESQTYVVYSVDHTMGDGLSFVRIFMNSLGKPLNENENSHLSEMFEKYSKSQFILTPFRILLLVILSPIYLANLLQLECRNFYKRTPTCNLFTCSYPYLDFKKVLLIKNKTKTSVNDVFILLLGQALQSYMIEAGESPTNHLQVSVFQGVSLNVSLAGSMSNNIVAILIRLPLYIMSWRDQLKAINRRTLELKYSLEPIFITIVTLSSSYLPNWPRVQLQKLMGDYLASGVISNFPGPDIKMSMAGIPVDRYATFLPHMKALCFSASFITVGKEISVCIATDQAVCSEPAKLHAHLARRLEEIYNEVENA